MEIIELKNTMTKIKNKKPLFNSRMEITENRISKLEDESIECI